MFTASEVYRDFETEGVPSSGPHKPKKSSIRALLTRYEQILDAFTAGGGLIFQSKAALNADLMPAENTMAWVVGDAVAPNNGIYRKVGVSGGGGWVRAADLPYSFIVASDVGLGTPNAIKATSTLPIASSSLVIMNIFEANTESPVTVQFNDGVPLTIKSLSGNDIVAGGLTAGMRPLGVVSGSTFRLVTDQASAAIVAQMEQLLIETAAQTDQMIAQAIEQFSQQTQALRDEARASADYAASSATEAAMYADMVGAAVYDFNFDIDPETPGLDWNS